MLFGVRTYVPRTMAKGERPEQTEATKQVYSGVRLAAAFFGIPLLGLYPGLLR